MIEIQWTGAFVGALFWSALIAAVWLGITVVTFRSMSQRPTPDRIRAFGASLILFACALMADVGAIIVWGTPDRPYDPILIIGLSAIRAMLLILGGWIAWDWKRKAKNRH